MGERRHECLSDFRVETQFYINRSRGRAYILLAVHYTHSVVMRSDRNWRGDVSA